MKTKAMMMVSLVVFLGAFSAQAVPLQEPRHFYPIVDLSKDSSDKVPAKTQQPQKSGPSLVKRVIDTERSILSFVGSQVSKSYKLWTTVNHRGPDEKSIYMGWLPRKQKEEPKAAPRTLSPEEQKKAMGDYELSKKIRAGGSYY